MTDLHLHCSQAQLYPCSTAHRLLPALLTQQLQQDFVECRHALGCYAPREVLTEKLAARLSNLLQGRPFLFLCDARAWQAQFHSAVYKHMHKLCFLRRSYPPRPACSALRPLERGTLCRAPQWPASGALGAAPAGAALVSTGNPAPPALPWEPPAGHWRHASQLWRRGHMHGFCSVGLSWPHLVRRLSI